jgi:hypothetical protein
LIYLSPQVEVAARFVSGFEQLNEDVIVVPAFR